MTSEEIKVILDLHKKWLCNDPAGKRADLQGANLQGANLRYANLQGADLPAPTMVLLANWGQLPAKLNAACIRFDVTSHPDPEKFRAWLNGGNCPYTDAKIEKCVGFAPGRDNPVDLSIPAPSAYQLMIDLIRECCANSDYHEKIN